MSNKQSLRKEMLHKRSILDTFFVSDTEKSSIKNIKEHIEKLSQEINRPLTIMSYMSFKNEFPTHALNQWICNSPHNLVLPLTDSKFIIHAYNVNSLESLVVSRMGISEPSPDSCTAADPDSTDLVLIPGVAFDLHGNRVGFGKGCYDRFLAYYGESKRPQLTALCYNFQITDKISAQDTDIPCDFLITEDNTFECHR